MGTLTVLVTLFKKVTKILYESFLYFMVFGISEFVIAYQAKFNIIQVLFPALFHVLERSEIRRIFNCSKNKSS